MLIVDKLRADSISIAGTRNNLAAVGVKFKGVNKLRLTFNDKFGTLKCALFPVLRCGHPPCIMCHLPAL